MEQSINKVAAVITPPPQRQEMLVIFLLGQSAFVLASRHEYVTPGTQPSTGTPWVEYKCTRKISNVYPQIYNTGTNSNWIPIFNSGSDSLSLPWG